MATWQPNYRAGASALIIRLHNEHHVSHPPGYSARNCDEDSRYTVSEILAESGALSEIKRLTKALEELEMELQDANEHIEMLENS